MQTAHYHKESEFFQTVYGCEHVIELLDDLRVEVEKQSKLTEGALTCTKEHLGDDGDTIRGLEIFFSMLNDNPENLEPEALKAKHKRLVLKFLDSCKQFIQGMLDVRQESEGWEESAKVQATFLPSREAMERQSRYETHLEGQLYRALNQLDCLQRQRRVEAVMPPLLLEVNTMGPDLASFRKNRLYQHCALVTGFLQSTPCLLRSQSSFGRGIVAKVVRTVRPDNRLMSQPAPPRSGCGRGKSTAMSLQWPLTARNKATHRTRPWPQHAVPSSHNFQGGPRRSRLNFKSAAPASISCSPNRRSALPFDPYAVFWFLLVSFGHVRTLAAGKCESGNP